MSYFFSPEITAFLQVVLIDLVLAGDNAIVIGLAAAGLPKEQRNKAILVGVMAATVLRIIFAGLTIQLLQIVGLLLAGGILLLWVCWKMWRELRTSAADEEAAELALEGRKARNRAPRAAPARPLRRQPGRSSSPTCPCPSTTFWRLRAPRASIPT